ANGNKAILALIRGALPELRPSERRVARLVLEDPEAVAHLSVAEVARRSDTSGTSVVRFTHAMGFDHYRDLRIAIANDAMRETYDAAGAPFAAGDIGRNDSLAQIVRKVSYSETRSIADTALVLDTDKLAEAVRLVSEAPRVDIFGVGASSIVGLDLQQKLVRVGKPALAWADAHGALTAAATLGEGCVAIGVSHSGATAGPVEFLETARERGAKTIAVTNHGASAVARAADVVLTTAARETTFRSGALGSRIAQLLVLDCLFVGVARSDYDRSMTALRDTYGAVRRLGAG
ncbi:MAG: MurR/RpiR family transcriptional regulator, partial [Bifidobacteriaceae bacterium]|nr:MurR/RpiR family transcriptional regulator [Bifidobacteriaceae bacterium]